MFPLHGFLAVGSHRRLPSLTHPATLYSKTLTSLTQGCNDSKVNSVSLRVTLTPPLPPHKTDTARTF